MTIGVDIDEVLADNMPKFLEFYNNLYDTSFSNDHFYTYDWEKVFGTTRKKALEIYSSFCDAGHLKELGVIKGAADGVKNIKNKHKLVVITGRAMTLKKDTEHWLKRHFPNCFLKTFYIRKGIFDPAIKNKFEVCQKIKADIMIEDDVRYASDFAERGTKILLYNQPWNQNVDNSASLVRVHSWEQVVEEINNY